jgi:hypothetical protein
MADDRLAVELAAIRERERAATRGPWEGEDDEDCWRLFGATGTGLHPLQILKAPKHGTPYAEYWPRKNDAEFIAHARSDVPRLLAAVEAVLELHQPGPVLLLGALCKNHAEYRFFSIDSTEQERLRACPDCQAVLRIHCTCGSGRFDRCRARVAITSALLGEENPGG